MSHRSAPPLVEAPAAGRRTALAATALTAGLWAFTTLALLDRAAAAGASPPGPRAVLAASGALAPFVAAIAEAALYSPVWRAQRRSFPVLRVGTATYALSALDALALPLVWRAAAQPQNAGWLAVVVGPRALPGASAAEGLAAACAGAGLLALIRAALVAHVHARAAAVTWGRAFAVVLAGWLLTRFVMWWTVELVLGRSIGSGS